MAENGKKGYSLGLVVTDELRRTPAENENAKLFVGHTISGLPRSVNWRKKDGKNYTGTVRDQNGCGACVAFSGVKVTAIARRVLENNPDLDAELSAYDLFRHGGKCENGWTLEQGGSAAKQYGMCSKACFDDDNVEHPCCKEQKFKILGMTRITSDAMMKQWIAEKGAVWAAMEVYDDDFYENMLSPEEVYEDTGVGTFVGNHAVCICGYDEDKDAWLLYNSWGPSWGDEGFCWIKIGSNNLNRGFATYGITVGTDALACAITPNPAVMVVGGSLQLNGNPTGGKPPYTHEWNTLREYLDLPTAQNPVFSGAPIGEYKIEYVVTDSAGTKENSTTTITVSEKPPVKQDITIRKAGTVQMKIMYIKSTVPAKTNLVVNGVDVGPVKKLVGKTLTLGKFKEGDTIGFALNTPEGQVQQNRVQDMGWAGIWYVMMSAKVGGNNVDVSLYVREVQTKTEAVLKQTEQIDTIISNMVENAIALGEAKQALTQAFFMVTMDAVENKE